MTFANGARRKKMRTRIISLVMVLALVFTLLPVYAIADAVSVTGNDDTTDSQSIDVQDIVGKIQALIKDGDPNGELEKLKDMDMNALYDTLKELLENGNIPTDKIIDILKGLIGGNGNIDTDKIIEILKGLIGGNGNIDTDIAGLIGSKLDVTGPKDVTVNEGETATFNVKVNSKASGLKYMWIEPSVVKGLDLGGIDFSGSKLEIAMKLFQALSKVSLSTTDTLALKNTAAADNGRTFACVIYNIALKDITLFVTDEAKLTVTPVVPCQHVKVIDTPAIAATCTTDGRTEGSHCSVCNEVLSVSEVIKATGHDFSDLDGIRCKNCGEYVPFPFTDVPKTAWCRADVEYVWQHGIMKGISATKFGPDTKMTRAMFVTVLYRMEGSPSVEGMQIPAFTDIGAKWCYDAIIWAYNAGVTLGKTATTFAPNDSITRAEIVTMVYRYSGSPTVSGVPNFTDAASVGAWARDAIIWATSVGVVNGYTDGSFGPNKTALRSEMAAMLHRYMEFVKAF